MRNDRTILYAVRFLLPVLALFTYFQPFLIGENPQDLPLILMFPMDSLVPL